MDEFSVFVLGVFVVVFLIFLAIGKFYPGSGAEQVDWRPTRSPELEAQLELDDVEQMIEAQNVRRRAAGRPEITEEGVQAQVHEDERWRREQAGLDEQPREVARVLIVGAAAGAGAGPRARESRPRGSRTTRDAARLRRSRPPVPRRRSPTPTGWARCCPCWPA